jgi:hypothetical protein
MGHAPRRSILLKGQVMNIDDDEDDFDEVAV